MADVVDIANDFAEMMGSAAIADVRRASKTQEVAATGECLFCEAPVQAGRRWCDAEHRDAWERERKQHGNHQ